MSAGAQNRVVARNDSFLLVDIGGSKLAVAVAGVGGIEQRQVFGMRDVSSADRLVEMIVEASAVLGWGGVASSAGLIVAAVPGSIDRDGGHVISSANVALTDYPLAEQLRTRLGARRILLEDDANCGAIGEYVRGAGRGCADIVYLSLSTGLGMGVIAQGGLLRGASRRAGEIGHMVVVPGGRKCGCGGSGCLEAYCSGRALALRATDAIARGGSPGLSGFEPATISGRDVVEAAYSGDIDCAQIVSEALSYLSTGLQAIRSVLDPGVVVFGGGLMNNRNFADDVLATAREPSRALGEPDFVAAGLGEDSVLIGALELALRDSSIEGEGWRTSER